MSQIQYSKNYLSLIDSLCVISSKVVIENGEKVKISNGNAGANSTLFYELNAPVEQFQFEGNKIGFNNFHDFYQIMNCYTAPELKLIVKENSSCILIKKDKSKFNYVLGDPEIIDSGVESDFSQLTITGSFKITENDIVEIKKMIGVIKSVEKGVDGVWAELKSENGKLEIRFYTNNHNNSFEQEFDYTGENGTIKIASEIFTALPKGNYDVSVYDNVLVKFALISSEVDLNIYAAGKNE